MFTGKKGQLQLNINIDFDIENCNALFVQLETGQLPLFLSEFRESKNGFVVMFDDIDTIDKAKEYHEDIVSLMNNKEVKS